MEKCVIGVDIGGTNVRIGIVTPEGRVLRKIEYATDVSRGGLALFEKLISHLNILIRKDLKLSHSLIGIGIGVAGIIDRKRSVILYSPNLQDLKGFRLGDFLAKKLPFPIVIENDANAFTLGEGWVGAARGCRHFCGITLGTGVGGGIVVERKILHGVDGMAGEVGHMVTNPEGPPCGCGGRGCLEVYASGTGIRRMALEAIEEEKGETIPKWGKGDLQKITPLIVFEAAQSGDLTAKKIFRKMGEYLGLGIINLIHLFNPEKIVIGGRVARAWDYFIGDTIKTVHQRSMKGPLRKLQIVQAECGDEAGILGAAYSALKQKSTGHRGAV